MAWLFSSFALTKLVEGINATPVKSFSLLYATYYALQEPVVQSSGNKYFATRHLRLFSSGRETALDRSGAKI